MQILQQQEGSKNMKKTNGFEKPNHTQTPNSFFDEIMKEIDTMAELKVTLAIIRQTIGWHRKRTRFGVGKIERLTGLARNSVISGAEAAEARGTIVRIETIGEAEWELVINDTPSTAEGSENDDAIPEGTPPQTLTENPSTAEGLKRKKETKEIKRGGGLTDKEFEQANAQVTAMIENSRKVTYANRDKIPPALLEYCDLYFDLTGQQPTKRVLFQWLGDFNDWISEGLQEKDIRAAYKHATRPDGGFLVGRPGSLTNTAVALKSKARAPQAGNNKYAGGKYAEFLS
jgi:hypothetical protein